MSNANKCSGCKSLVVNPVKCPDCGILSHPGDKCLARTGHPWIFEKLINCKRPSSASPGGTDPKHSHLPTASSMLPTFPSLDNIRDLIRKELSSFQSNIITELKMEVSNLNITIANLNQRITALENKDSSPATNDPSTSTNVILSELNDRQERARNIIIHGLGEGTTGSEEDGHRSDLTRAMDILEKIQPGTHKILRSQRLGRKGGLNIRPLRIVLGSANDVISILRNKGNYSGTEKITDDKTPSQMQHLNDLRRQLKELHDKGETNKTIRFIRGIPRIVNTTAPKSKN